MPTKLIDQLGPDTIIRFTRSAPMRLEESNLLAAKHPLAAIYLGGYAAEMTVKAAYFKNLGFHAMTEIDKDSRNRAMSVAQLNGFLKNDPHDVLGWARLLVWDKQNLHAPGYSPKLSKQIAIMAAVVGENWAPQMRYRNTTPPAGRVVMVLKAAGWLVAHYPEL